MVQQQIDNIETIKKAIEAEIKHNYIDISGKKSTFSKYILGELYILSKNNPKNKKWKALHSLFETYATSDLSSRMKYIKQLIKYIKNPEDEPVAKPKNEQGGSLVIKNPEDVDVMYVKGVGPKVSALLNKIGIFTAYDLLHYYPRKHLNYATRTAIENLEVGKEATVFGKILSVSSFSSKRRSNLTILNITIGDETGNIQISRFLGSSNKFMLQRFRSQYPKGANIIISGIAKFDDFSGKLTIDNAEMQVLSGDFEEGDSLHLNRIVPVYPVTENLNIKTLRRAIHNAIELYAESIEDYLPEKIKDKYKLISKIEAIKNIHFPESEDFLAKAKHRIIFEEFFLMQLKLAVIRKKQKSAPKGVVLESKKGKLIKEFERSLPFDLTNAQKEAVEEILADIQSPEPMRRLLQGDVGSGKTVVACIALLAVVENNYQGAIMAPTEILAEQHYRNFIKWLTPLGISVGLFVGKHGVKVRREMQQNLKNGQIKVAVGTHALIQDAVEFNNLGLAIIDEQHRFGVKQRTELKNKGINPELLAMTATPIPRTMALTLHGDMDVTVIDELPPGRKPVKTALISPSERKKAYSLIEKEIEKGHQAYIVFPLIDESETLSAKAATKEAEKLREKIFPELKIGLCHGKMTAIEKDRVMEEFRAGKYHILVSTTVIEVGVDVPNSTVMMIENSERFGLSQLHQLRGRVGRGSEQAYCVLVADTKTNTTKERLSVMTSTNNGFVIAESDLKIRGPGEVMGTRQSGIPDLILADLVQDATILELAREASFNFVKEDNIENYSMLKNKIFKDISEIEL